MRGIRMKIEAVEHITINVKDLERTIQFYGGVLGLKQLPSVEMEGQTIYYFLLPGGTRLELIHYERDTGNFDGNELAAGSCRHFAFLVEDMEQTVRELEAAGYPFHLPPAYSEELGCVCGLMRDPNGFELEFVER